jgi:hypothetical protein
VEGDDDDESRRLTPSPGFHVEAAIRREEEKARETYSRALRSVMAYLKDMNDLAVSQNSGSTAPMLDSPMLDDLSPSTKSHRPGTADALRRPSNADQRRPGTADQLRMVSGSSMGSMSRVPSMNQLRVTDSVASMQGDSRYSTGSVESHDSGADRKFKDDKNKRAMIVREIIE